jgi:zinc transport system substrate-binding protein
MYLKSFSVISVVSTFMAVSLLITGCKDNSRAAEKKEENGRILIYTSIQPIAFITAKIAGRYAEVKALIPSGKSPHTFTPMASDLKMMSKARFFFSVRLPFEEMKLEKAFRNSKTEWIDIAKNVEFLPLASCEHHHKEHKHAHTLETMDPHIWLNPENDMIMARMICDVLSKAMPEHSAYFELNFKNFTRCLIALDNKLKKMLAPYKGEMFLVYHPSYGYFAKRYGLRQEAIEIGGKSPSPKHLQKVIALAQKKKVHIIFVQPEFNRKAAKLIAESIKGSVIRLDPLAYNLIDNYMIFATKIQSAMKKNRVGNAEKTGSDNEKK